MSRILNSSFKMKWCLWLFNQARVAASNNIRLQVDKYRKALLRDLNGIQFKYKLNAKLQYVL